MTELKDTNILYDSDTIDVQRSGDYLKVRVSAVGWTRTGFLKGHRLGSKEDRRYIKKDVNRLPFRIDFKLYGSRLVYPTSLIAALSGCLFR